MSEGWGVWGLAFKNAPEPSAARVGFAFLAAVTVAAACQALGWMLAQGPRDADSNYVGLLLFAIG
jgi:hypothetical protein